MPDSTTPARFDRPSDVIIWLQDQGYAVGKSKVYADTKYKGAQPPLLMADKKGGFTLEAVRAYIKNADLKRRDGSRASDPDSDAMERLTERKVIAEVEKLEAQRDSTRLDHDIKKGQYIPRAEHERELASRARALKSGMISFFRRTIDDLVVELGADPDRASEALAFCLERSKDWFHAYAEAGRITREPPA